MERGYLPENETESTLAFFRAPSCTRSPQVWSVADTDGESAMISAPRRQQFTQAVISQKRPPRLRRAKEESAILIFWGEVALSGAGFGRGPRPGRSTAGGDKKTNLVIPF